jgi:hypothetical protein
MVLVYFRPSLLADNQPIEPRYWHKAAYIMFMSLLGIPGNLAERLQDDRTNSSRSVKSRMI